MESINAQTAEPEMVRTSPSLFRTVFLPAIIIIIGLSVLAYPVVATQWNNAKQQSAAQAYADLEFGHDPSVLASTIVDARSYNDTRVNGPILDPWLSRLSEDNVDYQAYLAQLSTFDVMARLIVPSAKVDLPVFHGTSDEVLGKGVGHLYGTDLPVGGVGSHSALTAHTGMSNATLFDNLVDVEVGDAIYVQVSGEKLKYEVFDTDVVLPDQTDSLTPVADKDLLTLITCTPYGVNSHRLLVHAERVEMDAMDEAFDKSGAVWQWWMIALVAFVLVAIALLMWWIFRQVRRSKTITEQG